MWRRFCVCVIIVIFQHGAVNGILLVIPEDVATGFAAIYGFSPRILKGNDHRFGFGFRFGNHADVQFMWELGPQLSTATQPPRVRSVSYSERVVRRPVIDFLLRAGFLKQSRYNYNIEFDTNPNECDEPR